MFGLEIKEIIKGHKEVMNIQLLLPENLVLKPMVIEKVVMMMVLVLVHTYPLM